MKNKCENIKMIFEGTIFDKTIGAFIKKKSNLYDFNERLEGTYHLTICFNRNDIKEATLISNQISYKRFWTNTPNDLDEPELVLRFLITNIKNEIEACYFALSHITIEGKRNLKNTEIYLEKVGVSDRSKKHTKSKKIYLDVELEENQKINKIVDSIDFEEWDFYIDERNNNTPLYNELLFKKEQNQKLNIHSLTGDNWKQLVLKEKVTTKEIASIFGELESTINKQRKKFVPSIKQFSDEYYFYYIILNKMTITDYYSNFAIPLLEQMEATNINVVYEYFNLEYHELFNVSAELKRQKEIEKNNLEGKEYVMPLSGILLKKLYWAVKNQQLDRKILKNNWFNTYYGPTFLKGFLKRIEQSHILELYESGEIYRFPSFEPYQKLYKKLNLKEFEDIEDLKKSLTKVEMVESETYIKKKKVRKICPPRDYVKLTKLKREVGRTGEDLVFEYEREVLKDYSELQNNIKKMYEIDESAGYDIESYDYEGNKIYIEVKTNQSDSDNRIHFHISRTEDDFITNHENSYIYYVYDLDNPKLRVIDRETYLSYYKKALKYEVDQKIVS